MQVAGFAVVGTLAPGLDRLHEPGAIRPETPGQRFEERQSSSGIEMVIAVEHLASYGGAGGFAAARQQCLA